jgi:hypothetical protein
VNRPANCPLLGILSSTAIDHGVDHDAARSPPAEIAMTMFAEFEMFFTITVECV